MSRFWEILISLLFLAAVSLVFFLPQRAAVPVTKLETIEPVEYAAILADVNRKIDDLSPTPPTTKDWLVADLAFAKGTNLAYITYHDTRNRFRILVEIGKRAEEYHYTVKANFEPKASGWQQIHGEDLAAGKELSVIYQEID